MICDNVRKVEGVWIHFIVYLICTVKTMQCYFIFNKEQGRAETFGGAGAQNIKGAHETRL